MLQMMETTCAPVEIALFPTAGERVCSSSSNLPCCENCKRHLHPENFSDNQSNICQACGNRRSKPRIKSAVGDVIHEICFTPDGNDTNFDHFIRRNAGDVENVVVDHRRRFGSIRVVVRAEATFAREVEEDTQHVATRFISSPQLVSRAHDYDLGLLSNELDLKADQFNQRGSNFVFERVNLFDTIITRYTPLNAATYVPTPPSIANKKAVVNVKNTDNRCFMWSILSCLHPAKDNVSHVSSYKLYENTLNFRDIGFPVQIKDIPKFEDLNPSVAINVISLDSSSHGFCVEYMTKERNRKHHVNLLVIDDPDSGMHHYVYIKNFSRLVSGRTKHAHKSFVCNSCLNVFSSRRVLDAHVPNCLQHAPQQTVFPDSRNPDECILKFRDQHKQHPLSFYLVCDFESFAIPADDDPGVIDRHDPSGFCCYRVTDIPEHQTPPFVYSGPNVTDHFYEHVMSESETISEIMSRQLPLAPMSWNNLKRHATASKCANCGNEFTRQNHKVRHHSHLTGLYLFPVCNKCNLRLKPNRCKDRFFLPIVFHNLKNYDAHFVIKYFEKRYTERRKPDGSVSYDDVKAIPLNGEKFLQFQIGNLKFLDSFQFLSASLEHLVALLLKSGKENFPHTTKYMGDDEYVFSKGVYPYAYMYDRSKFEETQLPSIDAFHDTLADEPLSAEDYRRAQHVWNFYNMQNMRDYHDHYLKSDVLLLTDVFQNFRQNVFEKHDLDCLHYPTLPSLAWSMALKHTGAEIDLLTDPESYLMVENSLRGGISTISNRYSKANNPLVDGYDPEQPTSYISYWDMNNLYGHAQSQPLPLADFRLLSPDEISRLDLATVSDHSPMGYLVECDLEYPDRLHTDHSDYPLAAEHLTITREMLSPFTRNLVGDNWKSSKKLVPSLLDKSRYVTHYRNLQFYLKHGLVLTKVHRVLSFTQSPWLKSWIDLCTTQRQNARSEFEADLAKLLANSTFGKTIENVRNRVNIRLIADPSKLRKAVSKPSYRVAQIINSDLVMVRSARQKVLLNKPIATGFSILDLSKLTMYEFYYDYLKAKYQDRCSLLFTDTDSLCCEIRTDDLYRDMSQNMEMFDTSNFEPDHYMYSTQNQRVPGKMKCETGSVPPKEFVGLRAKMYSLSCDRGKSQKKVKGIQKRYVKKHVQHRSFLNVLRNTSTSTSAKFRLFRSTNHVLNSVEMSKLCLSALDDKRYILDCGLRTLAYGHYSTRK